MPPSSRSAPTVETCIAALDPPRAAVVRAVRRRILALDPRIREEVKWNAPSYALDDHFATLRLSPPPACQLVLHTGAKPQKPPRRFDLPDPHGWVTWAAPDRAIVALPATLDAAAGRALDALVRRWMEQL